MIKDFQPHVTGVFETLGGLQIFQVAKKMTWIMSIYYNK